MTATFEKGPFHGIDVAKAMSDPEYAIFDGDDFASLEVTNGNTLGGYISTVDAGGTLTQVALTPGVALNYKCDGDDNDGSFLGRQTAVGAFDITRNSGRQVAYEAKVRIVEGAEVGFFCGLAEAGLDQDALADDTGALADKDFCGFHAAAHATDVDVDGVYRIEGGTAVVGADTLTEDDDNVFNRYGFRFDGGETITWFLNGVRIGTSTITAATFPTGEALTPIFVIKTGEAVEKQFSCEYWQCVELLGPAD